jgi:hypothetical protein
VIVAVLVPLATIEVGEAEIVDVAVEAVPDVKVTEAEFDMAPPFRVPVILAVPVLVDEVSVAL